MEMRGTDGPRLQLNSSMLQVEQDIVAVCQGMPFQDVVKDAPGALVVSKCAGWHMPSSCPARGISKTFKSAARFRQRLDRKQSRESM